MDCQGFSFGSFSTDETSNLFTEETRDLQFVWQVNRVHSSLGADNIPLKSGLLDVSSCIEQRDRRSFSPRAVSPSIPPNPPTSPIDEFAGGDQRRPLGSRKLNVNAMPFVPGGPKLALEGKNHTMTSPLAAKNSSDSTAVSSVAVKNSNTVPEVSSSTARHLDFSEKGGAKVGSGDLKEESAVSELGGVAEDEAGGTTEGVVGGVVSEGKDVSVDCVTSSESATAGMDCKVDGAESAKQEHVMTARSADSAAVDCPGESPTLKADQTPWPNLLSIQTTGQVTAASTTISDSRTEAVVVTCSAGQDVVSPAASPDSFESLPSGVTMDTTPEGGSLSPMTPLSQPGCVASDSLNSDPTPVLSNHEQHRTSKTSKTTSSTTPTTTPTFEPAQTKSSRETTPTSLSSADLTTPQDKEGVAISPESVLTPPELIVAPSVVCKAPPVKSWASIVSDAPVATHNSSKGIAPGNNHTQNHTQSTSSSHTRTSGQKHSDKAPQPVEADAEVVVSGVEGVKANGVGSRGGGGVALKGKEDKRVGYYQFRMLGEQLSNWHVSHRRNPVLPRGLVNVGNWCYTHAPLQALLSVPAVRTLFQTLNPNPPLSKGPSATPFMDAMIQFVHEFRDYPRTPSSSNSGNPSNFRRKRSQMGELLSGDPFRPEYIYAMLHNIRSNLSYKGRQEDAEEFLGCLLDGLHEEIVSANKAIQDTGAEDKVSGVTDDESSSVPSSPEGVGPMPSDGQGEDEEWEQVGPKNKSTITRQTSFSESPITEIFGGKLRSCLHRLGAKESATLEPFFSLQLDIQSETITSVKEALDALVTKETVNISEGDVYKRLTLARLPPVLIFHLKRFIFTSSGSQKLFKHIHYTTEMEMAKELLAPVIKTKLSQAQRTYKLWAVVYHHGKTATGGHYTSDVYHSGYGGWVRMDDSLMKPVPDDFVLTPGSGIQNKNAYLLFYRRLDTIRGD